MVTNASHLRTKERFFDTVNHSKLIEITQRTIEDDAVISLIHRYLNAGGVKNGRYEPSEEGTSRGQTSHSGL